MTASQAQATVMTASVAGGIIPNASVQLFCLNICGAALGAFIMLNMRLGNKEPEKFTIPRFLAHMAAGVSFGIPFSRWVCEKFEWPFSPEYVLAGGSIMGAFGVIALEVAPAFIRSQIKSRLPKSQENDS